MVQTIAQTHHGVSKIIKIQKTILMCTDFFINGGEYPIDSNTQAKRLN